MKAEFYSLKEIIFFFILCFTYLTLLKTSLYCLVILYMSPLFCAINLDRGLKTKATLKCVFEICLWVHGKYYVVSKTVKSG